MQWDTAGYSGSAATWLDTDMDRYSDTAGYPNYGEMHSDTQAQVKYKRDSPKIHARGHRGGLASDHSSLDLDRFFYVLLSPLVVLIVYTQASLYVPGPVGL